MTTTLSVASIIVLAVTLLPLWRHQHWLIRGLDFPRLQFATLAAIIIVLQCVFLDLSRPSLALLLLCNVLCLVWQLWWIVPYTPLWPKEVLSCTSDSKAPRVSIMTANVLTPNRNAQALLEHVAHYQPDLLVTLESDQWWETQLDSLSKQMPFSVKCPLDNLYGMHLYSRFPLLETDIAFLVEKDVPSIHGLVALPDGNKIRLHCLHPAPPSPTENPESGERDAELMLIARSVAESEYPVIVTGDLNDVAWSSTTRLFRKISKLLDPRVGRGLFNTFHADFPFLRWPLDHVFHSRHFCLSSIKRLPAIGSDHFALFAVLSFSETPLQSQSGLTPQAQDKNRARAITEQQDVRKSDVPQPGS